MLDNNSRGCKFKVSKSTQIGPPQNNADFTLTNVSVFIGNKNKF